MHQATGGSDPSAREWNKHRQIVTNEAKKGEIYRVKGEEHDRNTPNPTRNENSLELIGPEMMT